MKIDSALKTKGRAGQDGFKEPEFRVGGLSPQNISGLLFAL